MQCCLTSSLGLGCPSSIILFFFFECYGHHRDLHSFPTRRSSDLGRPWRRRTASRTHWGTRRRRRRSRYTGRSEEHTSELQSHSDLVCRLLLEKKKHT